MKKIILILLFTASTSTAFAQSGTSWDHRISTKPLHFLSGIPNAEIEFSPAGHWTNSIGIYSFDLGGTNREDDIFDFELTGLTARWNYYAVKDTSRSSWVWGVGFNIYYGKRDRDSRRSDTWGILPELTGAYLWNLNPFLMKLGLGVGAVSTGLIFDIGYSF